MIPSSTKIAVALAAGFVLALPAAAQQVTMMTGPQGGSWVPLGGALKHMWEQAVPGLQIQQTPGAGVANVRGVDEGKAQIGFANSATTVDGLAGRKPYAKKVTKVCQVANLYPQYFQVAALADSGIKSYADLKGKALVTQPKGNTAEALTAEVLKLNGYSTAQFGKCHEVPVWQTSPMGPFDRWPTGNGFEYFYGFIGGETNQYAPALY